MKTLLAILLLSAACIASTITGTVTYGDTSRGVYGVAVFARHSQGVVMTTTDLSGAYTLIVQDGISYIVTPSRNGQHDNSITSFDAAMIANHAVGMMPFTAIQRLAGDITGNGEVSNYDAAFAALYAIGDPPLHLASMWLFLPPSRSYTITGNVIANYQANVLGDVSQSWIFSPTPNLTPTPHPPFPTPSPCPPIVCSKN